MKTGLWFQIRQTHVAPRLTQKTSWWNFWTPRIKRKILQTQTEGVSNKGKWGRQLSQIYNSEHLRQKNNHYKVLKRGLCSKLNSYTCPIDPSYMKFKRHFQICEDYHFCSLSGKTTWGSTPAKIKLNHNKDLELRQQIIVCRKSIKTYHWIFLKNATNVAKNYDTYQERIFKIQKAYHKEIAQN